MQLQRAWPVGLLLKGAGWTSDENKQAKLTHLKLDILKVILELLELLVRDGVLSFGRHVGDWGICWWKKVAQMLITKEYNGQVR
jgi:hypothetical protein